MAWIPAERAVDLESFKSDEPALNAVVVGAYEIAKLTLVVDDDDRDREVI